MKETVIDIYQEIKIKNGGKIEVMPMVTHSHLIILILK